MTEQRTRGVFQRSVRRAVLVMASVLVFASSAAAGTITVAWDPNPEPSVLGYVVYVGNAAGNYTQSFDVGNATIFDFSSAVPGTTYHIAVRAYASTTIMSPFSDDLTATLPAVPGTPTLISPSGTTTSATPTYKWSAVPNSLNYFLWVNDAQQSGKIRQIYSAQDVGCAAGTGTCTMTPGVALASGSANWGVMASSAAGDGPWSATSTFTVSGTTTPPPGSGLALISQAGWVVTYVDSQDTAGYAAKNAFDGNPSTMWHTKWASGITPPPHELQIDLGAAYALGGFRYLPRQDGQTSGNIAKYEFYVSADGTNWGSAVATGTFSGGSAEQQVLFPVTTGRYVRVRAMSEVSGLSWSNVAELNLLQSQSQSPAPQPPSQTPSPGAISHAGWSVKYVDSQDAASYAAANAFDGNPATMWHTQWSNGAPTPPHELQIDLGASYALTAFRYLPRQDGSSNGNIGKYEFYVSADGVSWGTAVATGTFATGATEQQVTFSTKTGRYIRLRALSEVAGRAWTNVAELNVVGQPQSTGTGTLVPRTGWKLRSVDSQDTEGGNYAATNAFDGNPSTIWHTEWSTGSPVPPHEIQIDLGASYTLNGFRYLPRQDGLAYGNIGRYEFYVSTDGVNWGTAVATGTFAAGSAEQQVAFAAKAGRYIRLRALSELQGYPWTAVSELQVTQP